MLEALGRWIVGNDQGGYVAITGDMTNSHTRRYDLVEYCPFCGTHLDQLELATGAQVESQ